SQLVGGGGNPPGAVDRVAGWRSRDRDGEEGAAEDRCKHRCDRAQMHVSSPFGRMPAPGSAGVLPPPTPITGGRCALYVSSPPGSSTLAQVHRNNSGLRAVAEVHVPQ